MPPKILVLLQLLWYTVLSGNFFLLFKQLKLSIRTHSVKLVLLLQWDLGAGASEFSGQHFDLTASISLLVNCLQTARTKDTLISLPVSGEPFQKPHQCWHHQQTSRLAASSSFWPDQSSPCKELWLCSPRAYHFWFGLFGSGMSPCREAGSLHVRRGHSYRNEYAGGHVFDAEAHIIMRLNLAWSETFWQMSPWLWFWLSSGDHYVWNVILHLTHRDSSNCAVGTDRGPARRRSVCGPSVHSYSDIPSLIGPGPHTLSPESNINASGSGL